MIVKQNEYAVRFTNQTEKVVMADSMKTVAINYEEPLAPLAQITLVRPNVDSIVVDAPNPVHFAVEVTPAPAAAAGCVGTPNDFTVNDGTEVIFQAVTTTGFNFVGWYKNNVLVSDQATVVLQVDAPAVAGQTVQFEARFVATP
jgi:hypothetical protein